MAHERLTTAEKISVALALLLGLGSGVAVVAPDKSVGYAIMMSCSLGLLGLAYHHFDEKLAPKWRMGRRGFYSGVATAAIIVFATWKITAAISVASSISAQSESAVSAPLLSSEDVYAAWRPFLQKEQPDATTSNQSSPGGDCPPGTGFCIRNSKDIHMHNNVVVGMPNCYVASNVEGLDSSGNSCSNSPTRPPNLIHPVQAQPKRQERK